MNSAVRTPADYPSPGSRRRPTRGVAYVARDPGLDEAYASSASLTTSVTVLPSISARARTRKIRPCGIRHATCVMRDAGGHDSTSAIALIRRPEPAGTAAAKVRASRRATPSASASLTGSPPYRIDSGAVSPGRGSDVVTASR